MVESIASGFPNQVFDKPLNPFLGETHQARGQDGSRIYLEQTEHRPPTTHFYVDGPNGSYCLFGHQTYSIKFWTNSLEVKRAGSRKIIFADG